jgi:3'-5' exoribonuclease
MKSPTVAELGPGQQITGLFLVQSREVRQKKSGEPYLSLTLMDKTGDIDAKMWDNVADILDTFDRDDFVRVKGETQLYQNRLQFTVHKLVRVDDAEVDLADFLPASKRDPDEMFREVLAIVDAMKDPHIKRLLELLFADPAIAQAYKRAPAAKTIHHNWLGGLIEHVLSLAALARVTAAHYPNINADLLMAGVLLHDIGKCTELRYERSFNYTTEGQLLGHINIGLRWIGEKIALVPDFPPKLRNLLEHLVISHHGKLEFGSPKVPVFPEALLLHHLDNLDSKMETMRASIERDKSTPNEWTAWNNALETYLLDTSKYLNGAPKPASPPQPPGPKALAPKGKQTVMGDKLAGLQSLFAEEEA